MIDELRGNELINWRELPANERRQWWEQRWLDAIALKQRYRLSLRSGWWEHPVAVEAIEAYSAWVALYDTGALNDPQGKLELLWELEHLAARLRGGERPFDPARDRPAYERHLRMLDSDPADQPEDRHNLELDSALVARGQRLAVELAAIDERLAELAQRQRTLQEAVISYDDGDASHPRRDLEEVQRTLAHLRRRQHELRAQLEETEDTLR